MKIETYTPSMTDEVIMCKSTNERIPFPLDFELIKESETIMAFWGESFPHEPFIKDQIFQAKWNDALFAWLKTAGKGSNFSELIEKFLVEYENPEWKVMLCNFSVRSCLMPVNETLCLVVINDAEIVKVEPTDNEKSLKI